jgi:hypothetical protein
MPRVAKCLPIENIEKNPWTPYRDDGNTQDPNFEQPSNARTVYRYLCELSEIIHNSLYEFYTPGGNLSSTSLLEVYSHHLAWKDSLPELCHLGAAPMPALLYLQCTNSIVLSKNKFANYSCESVYYYFALIMLFRPFIKLRLLGSAVSPRDVCVQTANNAFSLVKTYNLIASTKLRR